jgi:hypothetical protein
MDPHFTVNSIRELPHSSSFTHFPIPGISLFQDLNAALWSHKDSQTVSNMWAKQKTSFILPVSCEHINDTCSLFQRIVSGTLALWWHSLNIVVISVMIVLQCNSIKASSKYTETKWMLFVYNWCSLTYCHSSKLAKNPKDVIQVAVHSHE